MYFILSWRNIWRNRRRTFISMASVFFAILLAIVMRSATSGVYDNMVHNLVSFSSGYIQVHDKGYWEERSLEKAFVESPELIRSLESTGIKTIVPRLETFALLSSGNTTRAAFITGVEPSLEDKVTGLSKKIIEGSLPPAGDNGILIGKGLADILKVKTGDSLVLIGQGYHATTAADLLPIRAIVKTGSPQVDDHLAYIPLDHCREIFSSPNMVTSLSIMLPSRRELDANYENILTAVDTSKYEVMTWKQMMPELNQFIEADSSGQYITIFILYLVISFGLFGTILMMTRERMHEFGILVAIGMKKRILSMVVMMEIVMIAITGAISGIAAGIPLLYYFKFHPIRFSGQLKQVYEEFGFEPIIPFATESYIYIYQGLLVFVIATILALYPVMKIKNLKPVSAINT